MIARYSVRASNEYIYTWLVFELLIDLGVFTLLYYLVYKPIITGLPDAEFYSKLTWGLFVVFMFFVFAITFIVINGPRYWIDLEHIEKWRIYRSKKKTILLLENLADIKVKKIPILSTAFNFATIVLYERTDMKKLKVAIRLVGIKHHDDVYLDILERSNLQNKEELKPKELLI